MVLSVKHKHKLFFYIGGKREMDVSVSAKKKPQTIPFRVWNKDNLGSNYTNFCLSYFQTLWDVPTAIWEWQKENNTVNEARDGGISVFCAEGDL